MSMKIIMLVMVVSGMLFAGCGTMNPMQRSAKNGCKTPRNLKRKGCKPDRSPLMVPGSAWKYIKKKFFTSRIDPEPTGEIPLIPVQPNEKLDSKTGHFLLPLGIGELLEDW